MGERERDRGRESSEVLVLAFGRYAAFLQLRDDIYLTAVEWNALRDQTEGRTRDSRCFWSEGWIESASVSDCLPACHAATAMSGEVNVKLFSPSSTSNLDSEA